MDITEKKKTLLAALVSSGALEDSLARQINNPRDPAGLVDLVADRVQPSELLRSLSEIHELPIFDLDLFDESIDWQKSATKGGSGNSRWICVSDYLFVSNPYDSEVVTFAMQSYGKDKIKDFGLIPIDFNKCEIWQKIPSTFIEMDDEFDEDYRAEADMRIDEIIRRSIDLGASDIHFIPKSRGDVDVRVKIDGALNPLETYPLQMHTSLSRLLIDGRCGLDYKVLEDQDARFAIVHDEKTINFRVASIPVKVGSYRDRYSKITIRILDGNDDLVKLSQLGLSHENFKLMSDSLRRPQGMILVTGPTGSGKSTTLYSSMRYMHESRPDRMYYTLEDPIEQEDENFVQIECSQFLPFSKALRNLLRQDPDVIMVGEIRDVETAEISTTAAMTGHILLSTLHTNDSHETLGRLTDMKVLPSVISSTVICIVAQRLVRKLCKHCRMPQKLVESHDNEPGVYQRLREMFSSTDKKILFGANPKGCTECQLGYKGRVGIVEVLMMNSELEDLISQGLSGKEIRRRQIQSGSFIDMWSDGIRLISEGVTSVSEVEAVLGIYSSSNIKANLLDFNPQTNPVRRVRLSEA